MTNIKKCSKCGIEKDLSEFFKTKDGKFGVSGSCKQCAKQQRKEYYNNNKEKVKSCTKEYYKKNKEKVKSCRREYYKKNKEIILEKASNYYFENKEDISTKRKIKYQDNEEVKKKVYKYKKERLKNDEKFKFRETLRSRIRLAFKQYSKNGKTRACKEYGIDFEAIFNHVGPRPDPSYHLDHIIPLSLFDLDNPEQVRLAHVPRNLRWLPGRENDSKGDKIDFQAIICSLQLRTICLFIGVDIFDKSQWL